MVMIDHHNSRNSSKYKYSKIAQKRQNALSGQWKRKSLLSLSRIDDIEQQNNVMIQMNLPTRLNQYLPRHWKQQGLDWEWVTTIWKVYILSEGDHRLRNSERVG